MNLCRKIEVHHHADRGLEYFSSLSSDQAVFFSRKKPNTALNNRSLAQNTADFPSNNSTHRSENVSIVKEKPSRILIANDIDLQFESCSSELNSGCPSSPNMLTKGQSHRQMKQKLQKLQHRILLLQQEHKSLQQNFRQNINFFSDFIYNTFKSFFQLLPLRSTPTISSSKQPESSCTCDSHKKMIDNLTKQFWDLQRQLKGKESQNKELQQKLASASLITSDPLMKIQYGLLQERGEAIKKLKQDQQLLLDQNHQLREILQDREQQIQQIVQSHETALMQLRREIDQIRESYHACNEKSGTGVTEKYSIEKDIAVLRSNYYSLEANNVNHSRDIISSTPIKVQNLYHSFARQRCNNPQEISISSNHISGQFPGKLYQRLDCSNINKYVLISQPQTTKAEYFSPVYQQDIGNGLQQSRLKEKTIPLEFSLGNSKKSVNNYIAHARTASQLNYEKALTNLSQIQRDVRKEINRSKEACR